jgi:LCP family protein required for cell wall assembly
MAMNRAFSIVLVLAMVVLIAPAVAQDVPPVPDEDAPSQHIPTDTALSAPVSTSPNDIPPPMPLIDTGTDDIINVLLLGSDTTTSGAGRTDVMIVVSVNVTQETVSLLSIPRDLYVYIPQNGMNRLNTAYGFGEYQLGEGLGPSTLIDSITYNLGLQIDHYARINFTAFRDIIDSVGGIEVSVDCAIRDWRLIDPSFDPNLEESWELVTLPVGVHTLDGDTALWYARSRRTSSDIDRGRRQQVILRALLSRIRELGLLDQITMIWPQVQELVETDMSLDVTLRLLPIAAGLDATRMASYTLHNTVEFSPWRAPDGASVLAPNRPALRELVARFLTPPTVWRHVTQGVRVEVVNAVGSTSLTRIALDRLAQEGYVASEGQPTDYSSFTSITDLTGQTKGSSLSALQDLFNVADDQIDFAPNAARTVDYRITLGADFQTCTSPVVQPASNA